MVDLGILTEDVFAFDAISDCGGDASGSECQSGDCGGTVDGDCSDNDCAD